MCKYCEGKETIIKKEFLSTSLVGWNKDMLATELFGTEYDEGVFIDRGYLRLVDLDDCNCLDTGEKILINYCPMCGDRLKEIPSLAKTLQTIEDNMELPKPSDKLYKMKKV